MASEPAEPDRGALGRRLRERSRSLVTRRSITGRALPSIGHLGARTRAFGRLAGLSVLDRVAIQRTLWPQASAMAASLVRPPAELWGATSGDDTPSEAAASFAPVLRLTNAEPLSPTMPTTGNAKYDALIRSMRADDGEESGGAAAKPTVARPIRRSYRTRRGLPSTVRRRGTSRAGRATAPGSGGRRFVPQPVAPAPTEATRHMYMPAAAPSPLGPESSLGPGPGGTPTPLLHGGGRFSPGQPMQLATKAAPLAAPARSVLSVARQPAPTTVSHSHITASDGLISSVAAHDQPAPVVPEASVALMERPSPWVVGPAAADTLPFTPILRTFAARTFSQIAALSPAERGSEPPERVVGRRGERRLARPSSQIAALSLAERGSEPPERVVGRRGERRLARPSSRIAAVSPAERGSEPPERVVGRVGAVVRLSRRPGFRPSLPFASRTEQLTAAPLSDPRLHGEIRRTVDGRAVVPPGSPQHWAAASASRAEPYGAPRPVGHFETQRSTRREPDLIRRSIGSADAASAPDSPPNPASQVLDPLAVVAPDRLQFPVTSTSTDSPTADIGVSRPPATRDPDTTTVSARPGRFFSAPVARGENRTVSPGESGRHRPLSVLPVSPLLSALQRSIDPSPSRTRTTTAPSRASAPLVTPAPTEPSDSPTGADGARSITPSTPGAASPAVPTGAVGSAPTHPQSTGPVVGDSARPVAAPTLADRFMSALQRRRTEAPRPLPMQFRPLARQVAGDRPVRIASGPASRDALAAVGKVAATTGDTVHLARTPDTSQRSVEVLAHEMTHVAHPSPAPRFFDDDHDSVEERRAEVIGRIMGARPGVVSGGLPTSSQAAVVSPTLDPTRPVGTAHLPVGTPMQMLNASPSAAPTPRPASIQRAPADDGTVSADEMIRRSSPGGAWGKTEPTGRGRMSIGSHRTPPSDPNQRGTMTDPPAAAPDVGAEPNAATSSDDQSLLGQLFENTSSSDYHDFVDAVVDALERRILSELDRRGGRFRGGI